MDLINRQDAIDKIKEWTKLIGYSHGERNVMGCTIQMLEELPSAQKTGKWIDDNGNRTQQYRNNFKCSECGHYQHTPVAKRVDEFEQENKFCHWCGSLMRGDTNG